MDKDVFKKNLKDLGMNLRKFSVWTGLNYSTVRDWGSKKYKNMPRAVPSMAILLVEIEKQRRAAALRIEELNHELSTANKLLRSSRGTEKDVPQEEQKDTTH